MTLVERFVRPYKHFSTLKNLKLLVFPPGADVWNDVSGRSEAKAFKQKKKPFFENTLSHIEIL